MAINQNSLDKLVNQPLKNKFSFSDISNENK